MRYLWLSCALVYSLVLCFPPSFLFLLIITNGFMCPPTTRTCVTSRHIFQELNTLLARLGSPNYRRARTLGNAAAATAGSTSTGARGTMLSSQLEEFLDEMAVQCDEKTLRAIKTKEVFYQAGRSKAGNDVYYYIARKYK